MTLNTLKAAMADADAAYVAAVNAWHRAKGTPAEAYRAELRDEALIAREAAIARWLAAAQRKAA